MIANELVNAETMRQLYVTRYSNTQASAIKPVIEGAVKEIKKILGRTNGPITTRMYTDLLNFYDSWYLPELNKYTAGLGETFNQFADVQANFEKDTLNAVIKSDSLITQVPAPSALVAASLANRTPGKNRETMADMLRRYGPTQYRQIQAATAQAVAAGQTTQQLASKLYGAATLQTDYMKITGQLAVSRAQAFTVAHTSYTTVSSTARGSLWAENDDIVIGIRIVATLDDNTTGTCRSLDGQEFYFKDDPDPIRPPFHYGCRSSDVSIIDGRYSVDDGGGKRPSVGAKSKDAGDGVKAKQVNVKTKYYDWLNDQPKWIQDEALGPERGAIFRNSGLTPEQFRKASVDQFYQPLTIDQMAAGNNKVRDYLSRG